MVTISTRAVKIIEEAYQLKSLLKEEMRDKVKDLEILRCKHLYEAKTECMIEVIDTIVESISKVSEIDRENILIGSLGSRICKFIEVIGKNIDNIDEELLNHNNSDEELENAKIVAKLKFWKVCLQKSIDEIIDIYARPKDLRKNASISEEENSMLHTRIENEMLSKIHFFQSLKKLEDRAINDFFDKKVKDIEQGFVESLKEINSTLFEQVGASLLNSTESGSTHSTLGAESCERIDNSDTVLIGNTSSEPASI